MDQERTFCPCCGWDVKVDADELCMHCGATATGPAVAELAQQMAELERLRESMKSKKTFCPNDGWDVGVDDENCCLECGWLAVGEAVDKLHEARELLRKKRKSYVVPGAQKMTLKSTNVRVDAQALIKALGLDNTPLEPKISEVCKEMHVQACHACDDFSCGDNKNKEKKDDGQH